MADKETIDTLVEGGKASPGPALAPRLAMMKLNIQDVFKKINDKTKDYVGMKVPVKIIIDKETKAVEIEVGTPPMSGLIKKELRLEKAKTDTGEKAEKTKEQAATPKPTAADKAAKEVKGDEKKAATEKTVAAPAAETEKAPEKPKEKIVLASITVEQCVKIAKMKMDSLLAKDLKAAVKQVVGTCQSMNGIQVEGKDPKDVIKDIDEGKYDSVIK
jgi:large subunit ribosomal protein L11